MHALCPTTICPTCGEVNPALVEVDFGIGAYEYWGATGYDSHLVTVTRCCEDNPAEFWPEPNPDHIHESEVCA